MFCVSVLPPPENMPESRLSTLICHLVRIDPVLCDGLVFQAGFIPAGTTLTRLLKKELMKDKILLVEAKLKLKNNLNEENSKAFVMCCVSFFLACTHTR